MENFVVFWNNKYPLDKWFRDKYKFHFNSENHRNSNLLDIYFQFIEEKMFHDLRKENEKRVALKEAYKKEGWLKEKITEVPENFFDDIDYSKFDDDSE